MENTRRNREIEKFYIDYKDAIYRYVSKFTKKNTDDPLVKDLVQTGFYELTKNFDKYNPKKSSLYTWTCNIIYKQYCKYLSKYKKEVITPKVYNTVDLPISKNFSHINEFLKNHADKKIDPYPYTIWLMVQLGFTHQEISDLLYISIPTIKYRLYKFIKRNISRSS